MRRRLIAPLLAGLMLILGNPATADEPEHMLSIVTSGSNDTQAMALILTRQYMGHGGSVQVLLCDKAGELALKDSDIGSTRVEPAGASPREMLGAMLEAGVQVEVCAIFLPNRAETEDDLREGVTVARADVIAGVMAKPGTKLFTN